MGIFHLSGLDDKMADKLSESSKVKIYRHKSLPILHYGESKGYYWFN
jgi:hypothetical protein